MTAVRATGPAPGTDGPAGLVLAPFRGVRFDPYRAPDVGLLTEEPHEPVELADLVRLFHIDPRNLVQLIWPREGPDRYATAARRLADWTGRGVLVRDPEPALYVYERVEGGRVHRGLLGALRLCPEETGVVLPHEDVMEPPVADRVELMRATEANMEPLLLSYTGSGAASEEVATVDAREPLLTMETTNGARHRLWAISDPTIIARIAADLAGRSALIADGHHRYATYLRYQAERRAAGAGAGPWDFGMAMLVDTERWPLDVRAMHRVLPDLPIAVAVQRAAAGFEVTELTGGLEGATAAQASAARQGPALLLAGGDRYWLLTDPDGAQVDMAVRPDRPRQWRYLETALLHGLLMDRLWGLTDLATPVFYRPDAELAVAEARKSSGTAVLLNPVREETVRELAAQGLRLPRKSTSFWPKLRSGFVLRTLGPIEERPE